MVLYLHCRAFHPVQMVLYLHCRAFHPVQMALYLHCRVFHPVQMILGCLAVAGTFAGFVYASDHQAELRRFKRNHSGLSLAIILLVGYGIIYLIGSVLVFIFGIALPLLGIGFIWYDRLIQNVEPKQNKIYKNQNNLF